MRKQCGDCVYSKPITLKDKNDGYIRDDIVRIESYKFSGNTDDKVICVLKDTIHRKNREQRNCSDYDNE